MMMMVRKSKGLGERHQKILGFIEDYQRKYKHPPSIREIGEHCDISSTSVVNYYLDQLEKKAVQALKRREADTGQQLQRLRDALMPGGKLQERVYPLLPYLAKYGPTLVRLLRDHIREPGWTHQLVAIARDGEGREETGQSDRAREDRPLP